MDNPELLRVCPSGCGSSGMPAVKALADREIPFDWFETKVTRAERLNDGTWEVTTEGKHAKTDHYDVLIVASGYHWKPRWPDPPYPGEFNGIQMHSHSYMNPQDPYDFQKPDPKPLEAHPTLSSDFLHRVGSGDIVPRPGIERFSGDTVRFTDGHEDPVDIVIWAAGYELSFSFFDPDFISAPNNELPRGEHPMLPGYDNLFFLGLFQPLGAIMPFAEKQAKIVGDHLLGRIHFPDADTMRRERDKERRAMIKRYGRGARHTMQVDNEAYHHRLDMVRKKGEKRAAANGRRLPIAPRAGRGGSRMAA